jgi:E1-E2 ATPase/Cation transporting ATPase, C-terminus
VSEPIFLLLVGCGTIYYFLGDAQEAAILLGFVLFIVVLTLYQERKTEKSLDALRDLSSPRALVIRDNQQLRIAGREVVVGDVIVLAEGDRVPADAQVLWSNQLMDEAQLLEQIKGIDVFARMVPEQKLRLVDTLKKSGEIVANLGMILVNRSWTRTVFETIRSPNVALWWVISLALVFLAAVLYIPALQTLFRFSVLHPNDLLLSLASGLAGVLWFELLKLWNRQRIATQNL